MASLTANRNQCDFAVSEYHTIINGGINRRFTTKFYYSARGQTANFALEVKNGPFDICVDALYDAVILAGFGKKLIFTHTYTHKYLP